MKRFVLTLGLLATCCVGCGPDLSHLPDTVLAEGVVTIDGKPAVNATIVLAPSQGDYSAAASSDDQGRFSLSSFSEKEGAVPGSYKVKVTKTIVDQGSGGDDNGGGRMTVSHGLPKKYGGLGTSGLTMTIPGEDTSDLKIELFSKGKK